MTENVVITLARKNRTWQAPATRVCFSVFQCFKIMDEAADALLRELGRHLAQQPGLVVWDGPLLGPLLEISPALRSQIRVIVGEAKTDHGLPQSEPNDLPEDARTVFIAETRAVARATARARMPAGLDVIDAEILPAIALAHVPARAWSTVEKNIYPVDLPRIEFDSDLDLLLIDCPARNLALMPNGLAYVHNALKKTKVNFQTFDLDIITYHRYHIRRLFDEGGKIVLPSGREMPVDPWQAEFYDLWADPEVIAYFDPIIREAAAAIIKARPKMLGLSIQQCNEAYSRKLVMLVREAIPDLTVIVGGFSCYNAEIGLRAFPLADYMCIGESDLTVGPLMTRLARGERPKDLPGVLSRYDTPGRKFIPAPMPHNLDQIEMPRYEWCDLSLYRNFNGYQLVPIIASRGCRWSRCTFCAERFYWRIRSAPNFVDELEWLVDQGCTLFMFNESDLNGMPEKLLEICDEIIRRDLKVRLTGQLRIHKSNDKAFFQKLRQAGFVALRFGVDAFSENTLRLQKKGYTPRMVSQNLKDCWEAGIFTEVNWVIGVPGETDADCDEGVGLILENQAYIGRLANINPLILVTGSVYWIDPDSHGIKFREPFEQLRQKYPRALPADVWHSVDPFIDAQVRKARFERIVLSLHDAGFPVGPWAERVIADVHLSRDRNRAGAPAQEAPTVEAELPRLVRALSSHNIVSYGGRYYGIPLVLGNVDLRNPGSTQLPGVLAADNEEELLLSIEHAKSWADSRGQYDTQARQRISGSLFKADSSAGDTVLAPSSANEAPASGQVIVPFKGEYIAVDRGTVISERRSVEIPAAESAAPSNILGQRSVLHRIVDALPQRIGSELRSIWRARRHSVAYENGRPATAQVISVMAKGLFDRYVLAKRPSYSTRTLLPGTDVSIVRAASKGAVPNLMTTIGSYNLVEFDGLFYGLPHGLPFDWEHSDADSLPDVLVSADVREIMSWLRARKPTSEADAERKVERGSGPAGELLKVPMLLGSLEGYNIVSYEGWVYGIPQSLGPIDLSETDVIGLEGVIRDVSRDVVENEIHDLHATRQAAE
jgi:radical SAM superfamily enzyme YgiQ (UPF0313 family)